ncbi:kinase-like domain-containing protein [Xylaria curta]|nr:kinase-like domain-containing protein [Xylaria curta]
MRYQHDPFAPKKSGMRFLPKRKLYEIMNEVSVKQELLQHFPEPEAITITDLICQPKEKQPNADEGKMLTSGLRRIFATLLLIKLPHTIKDFIDAQFSDLDLPFHTIDDDDSTVDQVKIRLGRKSDPEVSTTDIFDEWSDLNVDNFERWQWSVISPSFAMERGKKKVMHFEFEGGTIMPFCKQSKPPKLPGGSGVVCRVQIHEDYHDFDELVKGWVAVKQLYTEDETEFQREVEILKRVNKNPHDHLISLLATYRQHDRYHLMFSWADSDLMKYWKDVEPEPVFEKAVLWVAQQCRGITAALGKVHALAQTSSWRTVPEEVGGGGDRKAADEGGLRLTTRQLLGCHGDIKPQNLLWFRDHQELHGGTIRISAFGQAESNTGNVAHSPTYRPPECNPASRVVRHTYDIWSLGCVFLEFATWLLGGWRLVAEFRDKRGEYDDILCGSPDAFPSDHFWEIVQHDPSDVVAVRVKPAVINVSF